MARRARRGARAPDRCGARLTRLLLDSTYLIDSERSGADVAIADDDDVAIAAITVAEPRVGVELSRGAARARRRSFVEDVIATLPVIDYDLDIAEVHAQLLVAVRRQGRPRGAHDLVIAATARATGRTVVTADGTAFAGLLESKYEATGEQAWSRTPGVVGRVGTGSAST